MAAKAKAKPKKKMVHRSTVAALAMEINSTLGSNILRVGNDPFFELQRIPSGSPTFDRILGGGFILGRHYELYGPEGTLKSYICYRTMALSQQRGNNCALIDPEHSFDPDWFEHLGGDPSNLIMAWPDKAEDAMEAVILLFQKRVEVIAIDSVASLLTKQERAKAPGEDAAIASQARFMSLNLRRLTTMNEKTLVLWVNQQRTNIGQFFGNPNVTSGGRALKYYDTGRIEIIKGESVKDKQAVAKKSKLVKSDVRNGYWVMVKNQKSKGSRPFLEGSFIFDTVHGEIDLASEIIQLGLEDGLVDRTGNSFSYVDYDDVEWKAGSEKAFKKLLRDNTLLIEEILEQINDRTLELAQPKSRESEEIEGEEELPDDEESDDDE